jgi:hypothetical protein
VTPLALLLDHLALGTQLLEDHLCVAALVGVGVVEAHGDAMLGGLDGSMVMTERRWSNEALKRPGSKEGMYFKASIRFEVRGPAGI